MNAFTSKILRSLPFLAGAAVAIDYYSLSGIESAHEARRADQHMAEQAAAFHNWRIDHQDWGRYTAFPEAKPLDPIMWDYTEHALLNHDRRVWWWEANGSTATSWALTTASGAMTITSSVYSCSMSDGKQIQMMFSSPTWGDP